MIGLAATIPILFNGDGADCPAGITLSSTSIKVTLCAVPVFAPAANENTGITLTVNGSSVGWGVTGGSIDGKCITWTVTGGPLSYGDVISINFDGTWTYPNTDTDVSVTNTLPAPLTLFSLPAFNATTGRLDDDPTGYGPFTDGCTSDSTFVNYAGKVQEVDDSKLIYEGSRAVQNLAALTDSPVTQTILNLVVGNKYQARIGTTSASGSTVVFSGAFTGTLGPDETYAEAFPAAKTATTTTLTVTITGAIADLQVEDTTANADPDLPGEYEVVDATHDGYGIYNRDLSGTSVDANGVVTQTPGALFATEPRLRHAPDATNLVKWSSYIDSAEYEWGLLGDQVTITDDYSSSITGKLAQRYQSGGSSNVGCEYRANTGASINGKTYNGSFYIKSNSGSFDLYIHIKSDTEDEGTSSIISVTTTEQRFELAHAFTTTTRPIVKFGVRNISNNWNKDITITGWQLTESLVATPLIHTDGSTVSRATNSILHPYSLAVLNPDEGSCYIELTFNVDTDDFTAFSDLAFVALDDAYGTDDLVLGNASADGSTVRSDDSGAAITNAFTNIAAGTVVPFAVMWSASANTYVVGTKVSGTWDWGTAAAFAGFTETDLIGLLVASGAEASITDFEVLDSYLTEAGAEARWA